MSIGIESARRYYRDPASVFGRRLRQARLNKGASQRILGTRIGWDEGTAAVRISRYESGVHAPSFALAEKLAAELAVPAAFFYCRDDELAELVLGWGAIDRANAA